MIDGNHVRLDVVDAEQGDGGGEGGETGFGEHTSLLTAVEMVPMNGPSWYVAVTTRGPWRRSIAGVD